MILTFTLETFFHNQTKNFTISFIMLFLSALFLCCHKNALKPPQKGITNTINMTKWHYAKKGELHKYQKLCKILLFITITISAFTLIFGLIEMFIIYPIFVN